MRKTLALSVSKRLEKDINTYLSFIDIEKAFDKVKRLNVFKILRKIGVLFTDRRLIWNLYRNETAVIKIVTEQKEAAIQKVV